MNVGEDGMWKWKDTGLEDEGLRVFRIFNILLPGPLSDIHCVTVAE